ncbi:hypothetical protein PG987_007209 [Apiospora arundinis]
MAYLLWPEHQLYCYAYKTIFKKAGDRLYENVKQFEERWLTKQVCPRIFELISRNHVAVALGDMHGLGVLDSETPGDENDGPFVPLQQNGSQ